MACLGKSPFLALLLPSMVGGQKEESLVAENAPKAAGGRKEGAQNLAGDLGMVGAPKVVGAYQEVEL